MVGSNITNSSYKKFLKTKGRIKGFLDSENWFRIYVQYTIYKCNKYYQVNGKLLVIIIKARNTSNFEIGSAGKVVPLRTFRIFIHVMRNFRIFYPCYSHLVRTRLVDNLSSDVWDSRFEKRGRKRLKVGLVRTNNKRIIWIHR